MGELKSCSKCLKDLPVSEYYTTKESGKVYRYGHCKKCHKVLCQQWQAKNKEKMKVYLSVWRKEHRANNYQKYQESELFHRCRKKGVTVEWYQQQFEKQNGVCAICLREEISKSRKDRNVRSLAIDHCHITNKVRGLLCSACNQAMGMIDMSPGWLERARIYKGDN